MSEELEVAFSVWCGRHSQHGHVPHTIGVRRPALCRAFAAASGGAVRRVDGRGPVLWPSATTRTIVLKNLKSGGTMMDIATVSTNGQITVPADVRRALRLAPGDKIAFVTDELGDITVVKPDAAALIEAQRAFAGAADQAAMTSPEDADRVVADVRAGRRRRTA